MREGGDKLRGEGTWERQKGRGEGGGDVWERRKKGNTLSRGRTCLLGHVYYCKDMMACANTTVEPLDNGTRLFNANSLCILTACQSTL